MKTISKLKKELDKWFSLYIRLRDATDEGMVQCFTCGVVKYYKSGMQCGHFQSRRHLPTRFDEENCAPQCVSCNMFKQGEQYKFALNLDAKYMVKEHQKENNKKHYKWLNLLDGFMKIRLVITKKLLIN